MKKVLKIIFISFAVLLVLGIAGVYLAGDLYLRKSIRIAKEKFPEKNRAEDALIAYLQDTTISPRLRTHVAIFTLGQIQSQKGIDLLKDLYQNDPEGKTCYGRHHLVLCQYEIYKALHAREVNWWPLHRYLNR